MQTPPRRSPASFPFDAQPNDGQPWTPAAESAPSTPGFEVKEGGENHNVVSDLFIKNRDTLVSVIDASTGLVSELDGFNTEHWAIRYPQALGVVQPPTPARTAPHRSLSTTTPNRPSPLRSNTVATIKENEKEPTSQHPLSILALDLQLGHSHIGTTNLTSTLAMLGQATVSQMVSGRLASAQKHLSALKTRVEDTSSKVLVTGDLNAGKSTLINAILRRPIMPVDQQPCTTVFTEVLDAGTYTNGIEQFHAISEANLGKYDPADETTFVRYEMAQLEQVAAQDEDDSQFALLKVYVTDARITSDLSFLTNGIVSIALIDAPGLNRDTLTTTAVFAKQPEIDVVVFVASAENHLTLSAKDFLWNAAREKPNVFVIINKFAGIRDKKRCMRLVGDQIKQLSPATWAQRDELVHFVDAQNVLDSKTDDATFDTLEQSLRSFVLHKRASTKLAPAKHYLSNLLCDLGILADENMRVATDELDAALAQLDRVKPVHERLLKERDEAVDAITKVEETNVDGVKDAAWAKLDAAMRTISLGQVAPTADAQWHPKAEAFESPLELPAYPGVAGIWKWSTEVKDTLLRSLEYQVRLAEENARSVTIAGVDEITSRLADRYLPDDQKNAPKERIFKPEVMFAKRRHAYAKMQTKQMPSVATVGLGSAGITVSVLDMFDFERLFPFKALDKQSAAQSDAEAAGALSVVSLGVGALTMFGSRAVGVRSLVESVARACEVLGSPQARKWAGPVIGVMTIGLAVYVIVDLPRAVPRNIGRKLQKSLDAAAESTGQPQSFATAHADRISRETRKVLRLAGWDLRERCRNALEKSEKERREIEGARDKSTKALSWLATFSEQLANQSDRAEAVILEDAGRTVM